VTQYWFPDTTVLCNFASVESLPLLRQVLDGRGRWVEAIAHEVAKSVRFHPSLACVERDGWLREPIEITDPNDIRQIERVRRSALGGPPDEPLKHLGEAQTCHVILRNDAFADSVWITDDRDASDHARFQGIRARDTMDLVSEAVACGYVTRTDGYRLLTEIADQDRYLRLPRRPADL